MTSKLCRHCNFRQKQTSDDSKVACTTMINSNKTSFKKNLTISTAPCASHCNRHDFVPLRIKSVALQAINNAKGWVLFKLVLDLSRTGHLNP